MKHLRVRVSLDPDAAPEFFELLADSPAITEARLLEWNDAPASVLTLLYAVDGDPGPLAERATETPGIESVTCSRTEREGTYVLVEARPDAVPLFGAIHRARARPGLVVRKPVIYRDAEMHLRVVGRPESLDAAVDAVPEGVEVAIEAVGTVRGLLDEPGTGLTDRQREALATAVAMGYYDQPRGATHADVAAELGCVPATASDLLQRAEATLVRSAVAEF